MWVWLCSMGVGILQYKIDLYCCILLCVISDTDPNISQYLAQPSRLQAKFSTATFTAFYK